MAAYELGEIVRAVIDGARVDSVEVDGLVVSVGAAQVMLPLDEPLVMVTRQAPSSWPPQVGDVWRQPAGERWFAVEGQRDRGPVLMISAAAGRKTVHPDELLQEGGPIELVSREGWTPAGALAQAPPAPSGNVADARAEFVAALREIADLVESRPGLPIPEYPIFGFSVAHTSAGAVTDDETGRALVADIARELGTTWGPRGSDKDGAETSRTFGPIELRVHYCSQVSLRELAGPAASTEDGAA